MNLRKAWDYLCWPVSIALGGWDLATANGDWVSLFFGAFILLCVAVAGLCYQGQLDLDKSLLADAKSTVERVVFVLSEHQDENDAQR